MGMEMKARCGRGMTLNRNVKNATKMPGFIANAVPSRTNPNIDCGFPGALAMHATA
jgi:hypothetical protein